MTVKAEDATAKTELALDVVGQPQLQVAGRDGLLSARAVAGKQSSIPIVVTNTGSAPAENVDARGKRADRLEGRRSSRRPSIAWCRARTPRCRR